MEMAEKLMAANSEQIELDCFMYLNLTLGNDSSSQRVVVIPQATYLLLSQKARKELRAGHMDLLAQVTENGEKAECTDIEIEDNNGQECECPAASKSFKHTKR